MNISVLRNYSSINIKEYKNILKLNDTDFIVLGLNYESDEYIFYYDIYSIIETNGKYNITPRISSKRNFNIKTTTPQIDVKVIDSRKLMIYGILSDYFITYVTDLESRNISNYMYYRLPRDQDIDSRLKSTSFFA